MGAVETSVERSGWVGDTPRWLLEWSAGRTFHEDPRLDAAVRAITSSLAGESRTTRASGLPALSEPAATLEPAPTLSHEVATDDGLYIVRGSRVPAAAGSALLLVTLERRPRPLPPLEELCRRHGFTRKEARVAVLLAEGKSNTDIADELFISAHTARHHTESVLLKLGVHSRREVSPTLLRRQNLGAAA
jgi:DNA-binding NarL/FixJ family response regulator